MSFRRGIQRAALLTVAAIGLRLALGGNCRAEDAPTAPPANALPRPPKRQRLPRWRASRS